MIDLEKKEKNDVEERIIEDIQKELNHVHYVRQRMILKAFFKLRRFKDNYELSVYDVLTIEELKALAWNGIRAYQHTEFSNDPKQIWVVLEEVRALLPNL